MIWSPEYYTSYTAIMYMAVVVSIVSRWGLNIDACHENKAYKSKLPLHNPWISSNSHLQLLYISDKTTVS